MMEIREKGRTKKNEFSKKTSCGGGGGRIRKVVCWNVAGMRNVKKASEYLKGFD